MIRSLYTGATGMQAQQLLVDTISNNIANANTTAFKSDRAEFTDLIYQKLQSPEYRTDSRVSYTEGIQVGLGVKTAGIRKNFEVGSPQVTDNHTDIMINGSGFFQVLMPDGEVAYSRDGSFQIDSEGTLVTSQGYKLEPEIVLPDGTTEINITQDGVVSAIIGDNTDDAEEIGQIELATFVNEAGLSNLGGNLYLASVASGDANIEYPGEISTGYLMQGYLEESNVDVIDSMVNLITAQRSYELNSRSITVSDEMLTTISQLKR